MIQLDRHSNDHNRQTARFASNTSKRAKGPTHKPCCHPAGWWGCSSCRCRAAWAAQWRPQRPCQFRGPRLAEPREPLLRRNNNGTTQIMRKGVQPALRRHAGRVKCAGCMRTESKGSPPAAPAPPAAAPAAAAAGFAPAPAANDEHGTSQQTFKELAIEEARSRSRIHDLRMAEAGAIPAGAACGFSDGEADGDGFCAGFCKANA